MSLSRSQIVLSLAAIVTLGLTWQTYQDETEAEVVLPTRVLSEEPGSVEVVENHASLALPNRALIPLTADLFAEQYVKPKVYKKRVYRKPPPRKKVIPPLPFKYIGRWQDKNNQAIMLDHRGEMLVVTQGDVVANRYKVESINESAGRIQIQFLEMTLNKTQTLQARVGQP